MRPDDSPYSMSVSAILSTPCNKPSQGNGPIVDLGAPSMITAWLLRQRKVVVSLSSPTGPEAAQLIHVETSLEMVLKTLQQLLSQNHLTCHQLHPHSFLLGKYQLH